MIATKWQLDKATVLYKSERGFAIWWAGAMGDWARTLPEIVEGALLTDCKAALATPGESVELVSCDIGPLGDSVTFEMD